MINEKKLRGFWVSKGLTQFDVAQRIGVSVNTLRSKIKKGSLNVCEVKKLVDYLDIDNPLDIFFTDDVT